MAVLFVIAVILASAVALPSTQNSTTASSETNLYTSLIDGNKACLEDKSYIVCVGICTVFSTLGIVDKDGRYVESNMVQFVATAKGQNQEETMQTAKTCQSDTANGTTETGCERARQVFKCLTDGKLKEPNVHDMILSLNQQCTEKDNFILCHTLCIAFQTFGILNTNGRYEESKLVQYIATNEKLNREQVNLTIKACNSVNGTTETGCDTARRVLKCLTDQRLKINGEPIKL